MGKRKKKNRQRSEPAGKLKPGQKMPMRDAMALVSDDLPDGAYWAMVHEVAGLEYGDGFDELYDEETSK